MAEQFVGYVVAETPKALFFQDHYWDGPDWMPKSQCEIVTFHDTHEIVIEASTWICKQKQIREFEERTINAGEI